MSWSSLPVATIAAAFCLIALRIRTRIQTRSTMIIVTTDRKDVDRLVVEPIATACVCEERAICSISDWF